MIFHTSFLIFQAQQLERRALQQKEEDVRKAIHQLHNFIYTFQRAESPKIPEQTLEEPKNICSAESSATSLTHNDTSDSALPPYSPSDQNSPVSSEDQPYVKNVTSKLLYGCSPVIDSTEFPHESAHTSCSPDSSPNLASPIHMPRIIPRYSASSPDQLPDSTSDQLGSPVSTSPNSSSPEPSQTRPYPSVRHSEKSTDSKRKTLHYPKRLTAGKYRSLDSKSRNLLSHQDGGTDTQPTDLTTTSRSKHNGLSRMRRGDGKSVTASIR